MGLQIRKRTKGKNGWLNFSASKKNGLGASMSIKFGKNITYNTRGRTTINFGNGIRYVSYRKKKKQTVVKEPKVSRARSSKKSYTYTPVSYSRAELLSSCQQFLKTVGEAGHFTELADMQVAVDLYNAIGSIEEGEISLETRDLIIVTTNLYNEIVIKKNDQELTDNFKIVYDYLRSILPERPKPPVKEEKNNSAVMWGVLIGICVLVAMCAA